MNKLLDIISAVVGIGTFDLPTVMSYYGLFWSIIILCIASSIFTYIGYIFQEIDLIDSSKKYLGYYGTQVLNLSYWLISSISTAAIVVIIVNQLGLVSYSYYELMIIKLLIIVIVICINVIGIEIDGVLSRILNYFKMSIVIILPILNIIFFAPCIVKISMICILFQCIIIYLFFDYLTIIYNSIKSYISHMVVNMPVNLVVNALLFNRRLRRGIGIGKAYSGNAVILVLIILVGIYNDGVFPTGRKIRFSIGRKIRFAICRRINFFNRVSLGILGLCTLRTILWIYYKKYRLIFILLDIIVFTPAVMMMSEKKGQYNIITYIIVNITVVLLIMVSATTFETLWHYIPRISTISFPGFNTIFKGIIQTSWSFVGIEIIGIMTKKSQGLNILRVMGYIVSIYVLNIVSMFATNNGIIQGQFLSNIVINIFGYYGKIIMAIIMIVLCTGSLNIWMASNGMILNTFSEQKLLPGKLQEKNRYNAYWIALIIGNLPILLTILICGNNVINISDIFALMFFIFYSICCYLHAIIKKSIISIIVGSVCLLIAIHEILQFFI